MTRKEFEALVRDVYGTEADYPFEDDLVSGVFRHEESGKWFAIAMRAPRRKLGLDGEGSVDIVNFKCATDVIESIAGTEPGVLRAYHMNKIHWLTILLDGSCDGDMISWLLGVSYDLTKPKHKKR